MGLFKWLRPKNSIASSLANQPQFSWIVQKIHQLETRICNWLSHHEQRLTTSQKKMVLLVFCTVMGSFFLITLYSGLVGTKSGKPTYLQHLSITQPINPALPDSLDVNWLRQAKAAYERQRLLKNSAHVSDSLPK